MSGSSSSASPQALSEKKDHFYRIRSKLPAFIQAISAVPLCHAEVALKRIELHHAIKQHIECFPSDIDHEPTRHLVATLAYLWKAEGSEGKLGFEPLEDPTISVRLPCFAIAAPPLPFLAQVYGVFLAGGTL